MDQTAALEALMNRVEQLENRVRIAEDIEAIQQLTARYCRASDKLDVMPPDYVEHIAECFTEDGIWDGGPIFRAEGMEGFQELWGRGGERGISFIIHRATNPVITVTGDTARGLWHMLALVIEHGDALWTAGLYDNLYVRTPSGWKIKLMNYEPWFWSRHSQGWATERFRDFEAEQRLAAS